MRGTMHENIHVERTSTHFAKLPYRGARLFRMHRADAE
jgi:hypothetical protein